MSRLPSTAIFSCPRAAPCHGRSRDQERLSAAADHLPCTPKSGPRLTSFPTRAQRRLAAAAAHLPYTSRSCSSPLQPSFPGRSGEIPWN
ncbi:hypothetical protein PR202_gb17182 [Eleusine coracana subsp. coracana]|uniref:Uncharacterized protein n=1 Tax=Eleusine coracana subsp. coracana TaxID=191504 RepID=A0AAV5F1S1_ELECO|nr:hypothetical protein PR202_gb17182 [Eleusine coracana subsp. coracana]